MLLLSLCVKIIDLPLFLEYVVAFIKTPASKTLFKYLKTYESQPKLQFDEFTTLCSALMLEANIIVL